MDEKELLERLGIDDDFGQIDPETQEEQNKISGRLNNSDFEDLINEFEQELGDDLITFVGKKINVYKFRKISGITAFTTQGQQGLEYNPNEAGQYIHIYSSNEPVTIVWEGSTRIETVNNQELEKIIQVGKYETMWFNNNDISSDLEDADIDIFNINYKTQTAKRTIQLASKDWEIELHDQMNYLYLVLDPAIKFPQLLEIKHYSNKYHHTDNKKFLYSIATFESINFKFAQSGRNVLETIQFGAPGEEYAYPKEIINEDGEVEVILDEDKLDYTKIRSVNSVQIEFNNAVNFSSIRFLGRKKNILKENVSNKQKKFKVDIPSFLFTKELLPPKINNFMYNTPNSTNIFTNLTGLSKKSVWNSYKEHWKDASSGGGYNILEQKEVRAGLQFDDDIQNDKDSAHLWEKDFGIDMENWIKDKEVLSSIQTLSFCKDTISTSYSKKKTFADWNNINGIYNSNTEALNYSYEEVTRWSLKDVLGVLGGVVQTLMGGLDYGWVSTKLIKSMFKRFNFTQPWITLNDFKAIYGNNYDLQNKPQPLDFFDDNKSKNMLPVNTNIYCAYRFSLTNYFYDPTNSISSNEIGKGGGGIWKTIYIGQKTFENGSYIFPNKEQLRIDLGAFSSNQSLDTEEFIIDYIDFKVLGATDYKISCYDIEGKEIYGYYGKTTSKIKEDLRLWTNKMKLNYYDKYNTIGQIDYPKPVEPNNPDDYIKDKVVFDIDKKLYTNYEVCPFTFEIDWSDSGSFNNKDWLKINGKYAFRDIIPYFDDKTSGKFRLRKFGFTDEFKKQTNNTQNLSWPDKIKFKWRFKPDCTFIDNNNYIDDASKIAVWTELRIAQQHSQNYNTRIEKSNHITFNDGEIRDSVNKFTVTIPNKNLTTYTETINDPALINVKSIKLEFGNNDTFILDIKGLQLGQTKTFTYKNDLYAKKIFKPTIYLDRNNKKKYIDGLNGYWALTNNDVRPFDMTGSLKIKLEIVVTKNAENSFTFSITPIFETHYIDIKLNNNIKYVKAKNFDKDDIRPFKKMSMCDIDLPSIDSAELEKLDIMPDFGIDDYDWHNQERAYSFGDWSNHGQTIRKIIFENDIIVPYDGDKEL